MLDFNLIGTVSLGAGAEQKSLFRNPFRRWGPWGKVDNIKVRTWYFEKFVDLIERETGEHVRKMGTINCFMMRPIINPGVKDKHAIRIKRAQLMCIEHCPYFGSKYHHFDQVSDELLIRAYSKPFYTDGVLNALVLERIRQNRDEPSPTEGFVTDGVATEENSND